MRKKTRANELKFFRLVDGRVGLWEVVNECPPMFFPLFAVGHYSKDA